eukprot:2212052-Pleurochrysis_carterae.AAC.1
MTRRNEPSRLRVKMHGARQNCVTPYLLRKSVAYLPVAKGVRFGVHLQVPFSTCTRASHVSSFRTLQSLPLKISVAEHCLREGLDDVDAFQLKIEERNEREEDADGCRLS